MAGCATCLHKNVHPNVCEDCLGGTHYKPRIKTNADRIRSMTDEELAEWICEVQDGDAYQKENYLPPLSKSWWLKWLKQEADHA
jgi:hypothetical protein